MSGNDDKVKRMPRFPKSDDFAVLLGFRDSMMGTPPARTEQHKVDIINMLYIPRLLQEVPLQQDIVFSRFAALYLPELVKTYLNPPAPAVEEEWNRSVPYGDMKLANAYGYMLVHLNGNPYFDRYFRMPQNRTVRMDLIMALIDRLHERAPAWEQREANVRNKLAGGIAVSSMIYDFCQLLCGILLFESEERVTELASRDKVRYLLTFLHWWDQRYNPQHASKFRSKKDNINEIDPKEDKKDAAGTSRWPAGELAMILRNGNNEKEKEAIRFARYTKGSIQVCGLQGCNRSYAMDGGALLQCSQCSTVRYCSADHQVLAWKHHKTMHKEMCHKPVF